MKSEKENRPIEKDYDDVMFNEAGSSTECTGLIPSAVLTDSEYDSYEEIMDFNPPEIYFEKHKKNNLSENEYF